MAEKKFVFDFGRVVFRWEPAEVLQRVLPERATDSTSAAHGVAQVFQSSGGAWGDYDRGTVSPAELVQRIAAQGVEHETVMPVDGAPSLHAAAPPLACRRVSGAGSAWQSCCARECTERGAGACRTRVVHPLRCVVEIGRMARRMKRCSRERVEFRGAVRSVAREVGTLPRATCLGRATSAEPKPRFQRHLRRDSARGASTRCVSASARGVRATW
jgi:hypothetical protein